MKAWRRTSTSGPTSTAATCHQITSVVSDGDSATWTFDGTISVVLDSNAFVIDGNSPTDFGPFGPNTLSFIYPGATSGLPWSADPTGLSFVDGLPLCPGQTGVVE